LSLKSGRRGVKIFVSYSHADEAFKHELVKHLHPLQRQGLVETWHDGKIKPGDEWDQAIMKHLEQADIILLLVSIDFINSAYCYDVEVARALERHTAGEATVIPVVLRPCLWDTTPFAKLQALPREARAVSLWMDRDEAFVSVAEGIRKIAREAAGY
jgi:hypothetical protein